MTQIQPISSGVSPFDAIRRVRPDGSEYWSGRELMGLMAYGSWQKFATPLNRAMATARNQGLSVDGNFSRSDKVAGQRGPAQENYELSRVAAYLVAMNGDPNKSEVAAAQMYFSAKTREAEVRTVKLTVELLTDSLAELGFKEHKDEIVSRAYNEHIVSGAARIMAYRRHDNQPKGMETYVQLTIDLNIGGGDTQAIEGGA